MKLDPHRYTAPLKEIIDMLYNQPHEVASGRLAHAEASMNEFMIHREIKRFVDACEEITNKSREEQQARDQKAASRSENVIKALNPLVVLLREEPGVEQCLKQILEGNPIYNDVLKAFFPLGNQRLENTVDVMRGGTCGGAGQRLLSGDVSHEVGDQPQDSTKPAP